MKGQLIVDFQLQANGLVAGADETFQRDPVYYIKSITVMPSTTLCSLIRGVMYGSDETAY
jgi:hypothetical protein